MTNRSFQETIELVIFGLIALLVGLGVLWLTGWILNLLGSLFILIASFVWTLLRFILPVLVVAGVIYLIVRYATRGERRPTSAGAPNAPAVTTITQPAVNPGPAGEAVAAPNATAATPAPARHVPSHVPSQEPSQEPRTVETERLDVGEPADELRRSEPEEPRER